MAFFEIYDIKSTFYMMHLKDKGVTVEQILENDRDELFEKATEDQERISFYW